MLNWIAWNKTIFDNETVYLYKTKLFEIELFICINYCTVEIEQNFEKCPGVPRKFAVI